MHYCKNNRPDKRTFCLGFRAHRQLRHVSLMRWEPWRRLSYITSFHEGHHAISHPVHNARQIIYKIPPSCLSLTVGENFMFPALDALGCSFNERRFPALEEFSLTFYQGAFFEASDCLCGLTMAVKTLVRLQVRYLLSNLPSRIFITALTDDIRCIF